VLSSICMIVGGCLMFTLPFIESTGLKIATISLGITLPYVILTLGPATIGEIAPAGQRAAALAINTAIVTSAGIFAPWVTGSIIQGAATPGEGYVRGFIICGAIAIASGVIGILLIRPEDTRRRLKAASTRESDAVTERAFESRLVETSANP